MPCMPRRLRFDSSAVLEMMALNRGMLALVVMLHIAEVRALFMATI
jgi:hypothetical protein